MGAWGYKVFDNDTSCDFMMQFEMPVKKLLKRKHIHRYQYDDFRAAAEFIIRMSPCYTFDDGNMVDPLIGKLRTIQMDQDWIESWSDKTQIRRDLSRQVSALKKISQKTKEKFV